MEFSFSFLLLTSLFFSGEDNSNGVFSAQVRTYVRRKKSNKSLEIISSEEVKAEEAQNPKVRIFCVIFLNFALLLVFFVLKIIWLIFSMIIDCFLDKFACHSFIVGLGVDIFPI